jgi:hypothetical protein
MRLSLTGTRQLVMTYSQLGVRTAPRPPRGDPPRHRA